VTAVQYKYRWLEPIVRSIVAIAIAVVITFSADHSPPVGYLSVGIFAVLSGIVLCAATARVRDRGRVWWLFETQGAIFAIAGVASLFSVGRSLPFLLVLTVSVFLVTGALELLAGLTSVGAKSSPGANNTGESQARDWIFAGALSALFALVVAFIPVNFSQQFTGPDGVERVLTASVIFVGAFGAYAAILGVYLVIAGLSLKWSGAGASAPMRTPET
jgi:uncharacterized membrane protein HdeD (DUF308 family)